MSRLAVIAPRLARARDAWIAFEDERWHDRMESIHELARLERLVAHRDLQLIRAGRTARGRSGARYLKERTAKLVEAEAALGRARRRLEAVETRR